MEEMTEQQRKERIAAGLRSHRAAEKNLSQRKFAEEVGANASTVSAWEASGGISAADAWAAADYYGISLDELVGRRFEAIKA